MNKLAPLVREYLRYSEAEKAETRQRLARAQNARWKHLKSRHSLVPLAEITISFKDDQARLQLFWVTLFEALINGQFEGRHQAFYVYEFPIRLTRFTTKWVDALCSDWFSPNEVKEELARLWCPVSTAAAFVDRTPFQIPERWRGLDVSRKPQRSKADPVVMAEPETPRQPARRGPKDRSAPLLEEIKRRRIQLPYKSLKTVVTEVRNEAADRDPSMKLPTISTLITRCNRKNR